VFLHFRDEKGFNVIMAKTYEIAVIPGDGTGPEVIREGIKVLNAVAVKCGFNLNYQYYNLGGDHYKKSGEILPDGVLESLKLCPATAMLIFFKDIFFNLYNFLSKRLVLSLR